MPKELVHNEFEICSTSFLNTIFYQIKKVDIL